MAKIGIYGGTGFIGSNYRFRNDDSYIISRDEKGCDDDALYFISTTNNYNVHTNVHLDIDTNLSELMSRLPKVRGTFNFISSWFVYGSNYSWPGNKASENSAILNPKGFYSITKRAAEQLTISYCETFDKNYRIIRLCNVIGGDSGANKKKNALEFLIGKILKNEDIEIYDGDNYRNYLHVDDVCDAIALIVDKGDLNTIYNVGANNSHRLIDLVHYVIEKTGSTSKIKLVLTPRFHEIVQAKDFFMDVRKVNGLGFVPKYTIYEALDKIINNLKFEKDLRNPACRVVV